MMGEQEIARRRRSRVHARRLEAQLKPRARPEPEPTDADLRGEGVELPPEVVLPGELDDSVEVWPSMDVRELEVRGAPVIESGLSVDPDDLGRQWLNAATDQANFESSLHEEDDVDQLHVVDDEGQEGPLDEDRGPDEEAPSEPAPPPRRLVVRAGRAPTPPAPPTNRRAR